MAGKGKSVGVATLYLALYNVASALGWAYVLYVTATQYFAGASAEELWAAVGEPLQIVQTAAALEILHSLLRLVPSPVVTTAMQVSSRLLLVWVYTSRLEPLQQHWSLYLMAGSWAMVEVPRYLFYAVALFMPSDKVPAPLFFLRYNLFLVLYPSGISGEVLQIYTSLASDAAGMPALYSASRAILWVYTHAGPFMIFFMWQQRNGATKKRAMAGRPQRAEGGLLWPKNDKGVRSTSAVNQAAWEAATRAVDEGVADRIKRARGWRFSYAKHCAAHMDVALRSEEAALAVAEAGLEFVHNTFVFKGPSADGKAAEIPFAEAMQTDEQPFHTAELRGTGELADGLGLPYKGFHTGVDHGVLTGDDLNAQLQRWVDAGTIEPSSAEAIRYVNDGNVNKGKRLDLSDRYFVMLGASSAMGPFLTLMAHGANVIALDIDRPNVWRKTFGIVRKSAGRIIFPCKEDVSAAVKRGDWDAVAEVAGGDLLRQAPQIKNWIKEQVPGEHLTIGNYTYLDGELHVRLSMAADAIIAGVMAERRRGGVGCAFLCSPTDMFVHPQEAIDAVRANLNAAPAWQSLFCLRRNLREKVPESGLRAIDGLLVKQGPNYALAKRIQHWRVVVARHNGHLASSNIAPSTATISVTSNPLFALGYKGMNLFHPMEIMYQEVSNLVMAALLIHDVCNPASVAHPDRDARGRDTGRTKAAGAVTLEHPMEVFGVGAFHGGIWRAAFQFDDLATPATAMAALKVYGLPFFSVEALVGYAVAAVTAVAM